MYIDSTGRFVATNELKHYGIKGMEWGKRNGPPYPLDAVTSARVRMNATHSAYHYKEKGKFVDTHESESLKSLRRIKSGDDISAIRFNINHSDDKWSHSYNCPNCAAAFDMVERGYNVCARGKPSGSNVENIETFFKGGKLTAINSGKLSNMKEIRNAFDAYTKAQNKSRRKREKAGNKLREEYDKAKEVAIDATLKQLSSQGEGARGILVVGWQMTYNPSYRAYGYHALNYKIENGTPTFYDSQSSSKSDYNGNKKTDFLWGADPREIYTMRTDTLEPSEEMTKAVYSSRR